MLSSSFEFSPLSLGLSIELLNLFEAREIVAEKNFYRLVVRLLCCAAENGGKMRGRAASDGTLEAHITVGRPFRFNWFSIQI